MLRGAPGVTALFEGLERDGSHTVLDFGPAAESSLRYYGRFARRVRFAGLLAAPPAAGSWDDALKSIPRDPEHPYDVIVAWNLLDRMEREQRPIVVQRLVELTAPGARIYLLVDMSEARVVRPFRFTILDDGRVSQEPAGPPQSAWPTILPADVEQLLVPFEVEHSFVLRMGMREYVAARP